MKNLTHEEWVLLNKQTDKVLAEWYSILNNWGWIKELGLPEDPKDKKNGKRMAFMKAIKRLVSEKLISRIWNKDMPNDEFTDWWNNGESPDENVREEWFKKH